MKGGVEKKIEGVDETKIEVGGTRGWVEGIKGTIDETIGEV
jgi:hypothetical protein